MISRTRGYLPHILTPDGIYFITFRLVDSLPAESLIRWKQELAGNKKRISDANILTRLELEYYRKVQDISIYRTEVADSKEMTLL